VSDKTEEPTPRRLRKAREDGDSPVSSALVQAAGFVVAITLAPAAVAATAGRATARIQQALEHPLQAFSPMGLALDVLTLSLPLIAAAALVSAVVGFVQTGGIVATKKLAPDLSKANPITGLKNIFNWQRILGVVRSLVGALVVGWLAVRLLADHGGDLANCIGNIGAAAVVASDLARHLLWIAALVGLGLALLDVLITHWSWKKRLRMSKDEVKREYKESEGDPEIKQARKQAHHEMLRGATISAVKDATVVIVNPTHLATALHYVESDEEDAAPRIVAQGEGDLARQMIDAARAWGIPVVRDVPIARALSELEIGDEIPEALYEAVAEILREVWEQAGGDEADASAGD
jgi:flagellar biosynthesis protein FlhB